MERKAVSYYYIKFYKEGIVVRRGIYPGSFDPMTKGHLDLIERAANLVDELYVAVLVNPNKTSGMLSIKDRVEILEKAASHLTNVKVEHYYGLLADYAREIDAKVIIRGLRSYTDFDTELSMAQINKALRPDLETIFLMTAPKYAHISSSHVRELIHFKGDYEWMIPEAAANKIKNILMEG